MGQHRKSKKVKSPKDMTINPADVKIRKRIAPGVRIILSDKEKDNKHKKKFLESFVQEDTGNED